MRGRVWLRPALALLGLHVLALCAWLFIRSGTPTLERSRTSRALDASIPLHPRGDVPRPEPADAETGFPDRSRVAQLGIESPQPPPPATSWTTRPGTLVFGALVDPSHAPIRGAWSASVDFVDRDGKTRSADARSEAGYTLQALEFGTYRVTANADGYRSLEATVELRPDAPQMRTDFTLQKAVELQVRVTTPEGRNLFDVLKEIGAPIGARLLVPVATRERPAKRLDEVGGSMNGKFGVGCFQDHGPRVEKLAPGRMGILSVDCDLPVWVSLVHYQSVLQTKRVIGSQADVTFIVAPDDLLADLATIRAHVIDVETGLPIERARVMLVGGPCFDPGVATDAHGDVIIDGREPGCFDLQVWAAGYARARVPLDALPGEITDLGTVALESEVTVAGRVLDSEGRPLASSFSVGILDPVNGVVDWFRQQRFKSRGDGSFDIRGLGRGEYVIRSGDSDVVDERGWEGIAMVSGNLVIDTRAGPISGLEILMRPASTLVIEVAAGAADGMRFRVVDERGIELIGSRFDGSWPRLLQLPAGRCRVSLLDPAGAVLSERSITLGSETVKLDLIR